MFTSITWPQANEQAEAVNKAIKHNIKMKLEDLKGRWADKLAKVLWAYKTTTRLTTGETPFSLAYGYEAMVLVEVREGHCEERITTQSRMRPHKGVSSISLKRNDATLNSGSRRINGIQLNISAQS